MANPCAAHGGSVAKNGYGPIVVAASSAIDSALVLAGFGTTAAILAPLIAGETYYLTSFCPNDPPAMPTLTTDDIADALNFTNPFVSVPAIQKLKQWFEAWFWYQACICADGTSASAPSLSLPTTPTLNSGLPAAPSGNTCWDSTQTLNWNAAFASANYDMSRLLWNDPAQASPSTAVVRNLPAGGITQLTVREWFDGGGSAIHCLIGFTWYASNGTVLRTDNNYAGRTTTADETWTQTPPTGAAAVAVNVSIQGVTSANYQNGHARVQLYCAGQSPSTPASACCPPDPNVELRLQQILGLLNSIYSGLPTQVSSYAESTVHSGLSGNGTVTLTQSCLGVKVVISTDSPSAGTEAGTPPYLFDRGYIVPIAAEGPIAGNTRLVYNPQFLPLAYITEQIGYSLRPGVTISIIEVIRGP